VETVSQGNVPSCCIEADVDGADGVDMEQDVDASHERHRRRKKKKKHSQSSPDGSEAGTDSNGMSSAGAIYNTTDLESGFNTSLPFVVVCWDLCGSSTQSCVQQTSGHTLASARRQVIMCVA
jgi:hypothetical protein